jgi:hypothetical protein
MKWIDLKDQAQKILENEPNGDYTDQAFKMTSGGTPRNPAGVKILRQETKRGHKTVRHGYAVSSETVVRCRDTGAMDGRDRIIYEDEDGTLFVWSRQPGDTYGFDSAALLEPVLE